MQEKKNTFHRILVLTAKKTDSDVLTNILTKAGIGSAICVSIEELCSHIETDADAAIITDEMLIGEATALLKRRRQYQIRDELGRRRRAEETLKKESQRKNEFLAVLGHELRNPIATLKTAMELLCKDHSIDRSSWIEEKMTNQVHQLQRLVDDLIDVSRITRGKVELIPEPVDLTKQMAYAVEAMKPDAEKQHQHICLSTFEERVYVRADPLRLQQIFTNLLKNAISYTPEDGDIWFSAKKEQDTVVISCRDNGIGIPEDKIDMVFEPFIEINTPLRRAEGGLGIGLTMAKHLTEMHGGSLEVISEGVGTGSEFIVRLSVCPPPHRVEERVIEQPRYTVVESCSILIVEDNIEFAELLGETLKEEGHRTHIVGNGEEAIEKAGKEAPDFVLIDIGLPGIDGYAVAEKLRLIPVMKNAVLIALSGYTQQSSQTNTLFDHYNVKGADIDRLFHIISGR